MTDDKLLGLGKLAEDVGVHVANKLANEAVEQANGDMRGMIRKKVLELIGDRPVKVPLFYESITEASSEAGRIRIWRHYDKLPTDIDMELLLLVSKIPMGASMQDVIDIVSTVDGVSAIELVNPTNNGVVGYYTW